MNVTVSLRSMEDVKRFTNIANEYSIDIDIGSGRYVVDAKSIMGVFSLDISKPLNVIIHDSGDKGQNFIEEISGFIVK